MNERAVLEENDFCRALFESRQVAGSAKYKLSKTVLKLYCRLRSECLFSFLHSHNTVVYIKDILPFINTCLISCQLPVFCCICYCSVSSVGCSRINESIFEWSVNTCNNPGKASWFSLVYESCLSPLLLHYPVIFDIVVVSRWVGC